MNGSSKQRRPKKLKRQTGEIILILLAVLLLGYLLAGFRYKKSFLPNTRIGGLFVSGMTIEEVKAEIDARVSHYELVLEQRGGIEERIAGKDIGLYPVYGSRLEEILAGQNTLLWGLRYWKGEVYQQGQMVVWDQGKLEAAVGGLSCLAAEQITQPADAHLIYTDGVGLQIAPEEPGNQPVPERLSEEIAKAVSGLQERISLEALDVYQKPQVLQGDPVLLERMNLWKPVTDVVVTYHFGSKTENLDGNTIVTWLYSSPEAELMIDREKVEAYVQKLAKTYNTAYCKKEFKTSYGQTVTITKGNYGWMINKQAEADALIQIVLSGKSQDREPVYIQTAASHDGPDYGSTYVEMNLTAQHLYFYKNGELLIESDFVSGNEEKGYSTPAGAYPLTYKQLGAVLKGENYNTPVTYWMPFNGNIGMHDGYWRSLFGGTIYKKSGSHGCVNLPPAAAKTIYENIEAGTPVLCYHLDGTETKKTTVVKADQKTN